MTRVKRSVHARKKRRATLEMAKGYRGDASRHYRAAKEAVLKADQYRYRDRRNRKRDFRRLWITRINAAARQNGLSYSQFMHGLQARRGRAGPQDPGRHRRSRRRHLPTVCRPRPRGAGGRLTSSRKPAPPTGAAPAEQAPFLFSEHLRPSPDDHHQPPQLKLKEIRKLGQRRRWRERSRPFRRRGRGSAGGCRRRGWTAIERYCAAGSGLPGTEVEPALLASASGLGSGTRALAVYEERWAPAAPGRYACTYTGSATRATSARSCAPRRRSEPRGWRLAPAPPIRSAPERCGPDGRRVRCAAGARRAGWPSSRARRSRWSLMAGRCAARGRWRSAAANPAGDHAAGRRRARGAARTWSRPEITSQGSRSSPPR